jgi:hypothetical protein
MDALKALEARKSTEGEPPRSKGPGIRGRSPDSTAESTVDSCDRRPGQPDPRPGDRDGLTRPVRNSLNAGNLANQDRRTSDSCHPRSACPPLDRTSDNPKQISSLRQTRQASRRAGQRHPSRETACKSRPGRTKQRFEHFAMSLFETWAGTAPQHCLGCLMPAAGGTSQLARSRGQAQGLPNAHDDIAV